MRSKPAGSFSPANCAGSLGAYERRWPKSSRWTRSSAAGCTGSPGCIGVHQVEDPRWDRLGLDYVAKLDGGAKVGIDHKTRDPGAARYWRFGEPEMALELWSVMPVNGTPGTIGWTLNRRSRTHYVLFTWDVSDSSDVYLLPFQQLRVVFERNRTDWARRFPVKEQGSVRDGDHWRSQAIFVPSTTVYETIYAAMKSPLRNQGPS